jgi:hypothetical protein
VREHYYIGPAWYQREIDVPENWAGSPLRLKLERVIWESRVWVDDREIGSCDSLAAPHVYVWSVLVGILDPFWQSKSVVTADDVRAWNSETAALARFKSFVWGEGQTFQARLEVAHYGAHDLPAGQASWRLSRQDGDSVAEGRLAHGPLPTGGSWPLGAIEVPLDGFEAASALELSVQIGEHENDWPLWVYPRGVAEVPASVHVTKQFDHAAREVLADGGRVLLLTHGRSYENAGKAGFFSVFWSAGWWGDQFSSLGILCNPAHPALAEFPNAGHSDSVGLYGRRRVCTGVPSGLGNANEVVQPLRTWGAERGGGLL